MTTEQRLERLARENRWMWRIGAAAVAVVAAVFLIGQGKRKELQDIEVRTLTVKDEAGVVCARLGATELIFLDKHGKDRATFGAGDGVAGLTFTPTFQLGASFGSQALNLYDENRKLRLSLKTWRGSPSLRFYDAQGNVIWQAPR
ncbi:MAG: hypothetical protein ACYS0K_01230 [Planctomycetota bacterium]|jgi:hypothetical protein